jgi:hypothetical protein
MRSKPLLLVMLVGVGLVAAGYHRTVKQPVPEKVDVAPDPLLIEFSEYKKWTLVNPVPELMALQAAQDCVLVLGRKEGSPHLNKYISVYVNDTGRAAMMTQLRPRFPAGSMIVKEKLSSEKSTTPELLTAMVKREPGYNPESGDWEFVVLSGKADAITGRGKLTNCQACHLAYQRSDFVTRTYLPHAIREKLK